MFLDEFDFNNYTKFQKNRIIIYLCVGGGEFVIMMCSATHSLESSKKQKNHQKFITPILVIL